MGLPLTTLVFNLYGGFFSVALSVVSLRLAVSQQVVLCSSDFPLLTERLPGPLLSNIGQSPAFILGIT